MFRKIFLIGKFMMKQPDWRHASDKKIEYPTPNTECPGMKEITPWTLEIPCWILDIQKISHD